MADPHPNDKDARIRTLKREVRRARNEVANTAVIDAMTRAALVAARARIDELEAEVERLKHELYGPVRSARMCPAHEGCTFKFTAIAQTAIPYCPVCEDLAAAAAHQPGQGEGA